MVGHLEPVCSGSALSLGLSQGEPSCPDRSRLPPLPSPVAVAAAERSSFGSPEARCRRPPWPHPLSSEPYRTLLRLALGRPAVPLPCQPPSLPFLNRRKRRRPQRFLILVSAAINSTISRAPRSTQKPFPATPRPRQRASSLRRYPNSRQRLSESHSRQSRRAVLSGPP